MNNLFSDAATTRPQMQGGNGQIQQQLRLGDQSMSVAEVASPISSRAPAGNLEELLPAAGDYDALAAGGDAGASIANRWPRQETLALLKVRSDMDAAFRDATLKGPLWEEVSRKLAELGYKRNAKKCKEKFENVHKYYKRTKEGRAGRQDGKCYKFFSQLEALHTTCAAAVPTNLITATPASVGIGFGSSMQIPGTASASPIFPPIPADNLGGMSFSSNGSSSTSSGFEMDGDENEVEEDGLDGEPASSRKRRREQEGRSSGRMMEFFEDLMRQVMQKQEAMQQRFLEAIEKREQDRMIREEAWRRQEMARISREQELIAQERAMSINRDNAIISFIQKLTGQTIQMPPAALTVPTVPPPAPPPPTSFAVTDAGPQPTLSQLQTHHQPQQRTQQKQLQNQDEARRQLLEQPISSGALMIVPEQQLQPGLAGTSDQTSSRWPKAEVLALINLRSGLESRYQEAGPKGPLWEEISLGMQRFGYKRNAKRCKEKWENINKYFKKVKESNKKRPEDSKTCPYFHQLDELYRKKILGGSPGSVSFLGFGSSSGTNMIACQNRSTQQQQQSIAPGPIGEYPAIEATKVTQSEGRSGDAAVRMQANGSEGLPANLFTDGCATTTAAANKPEDIVKNLMMPHHHQQLLQQQDIINDRDNMVEAADSDNMGDSENEEEEEDDEVEEEESEEERNMDFKIEFQRRNAGPTNGGGNGAPSFLAMVQ